MSALAEARTPPAEPERQPIARVWVICPGAAPYPINSAPLDRARLEATQRMAGPPAERNARIVSARLPQNRRWQVDTSPDARCVVTGASYEMQQAIVADQRPASQLGVTPIAAAKAYGVPYRQVYAAFVTGLSERAAPIGRLDHWSCWYAHHRDLELVFGDAAKRRATEAASPEWMSRTAQRMARRKIRTYRSDGGE